MFSIYFVCILCILQDSPPSQLAGSSATTANPSDKLGTFRRMLNAIRYCFTKRGRSKKPDWLLDKQPHRTRSKSIPSEDVPSDASTANILCSHLSVDPSLPSHYRVCIYCANYLLFNSLFERYAFFYFSLSIHFEMQIQNVFLVNKQTALW